MASRVVSCCTVHTSTVLYRPGSTCTGVGNIAEVQTRSLAADEVGKRIVARRRLVEFTQERLAEMAGQDLLTVRRAEHGATDLRLSTLVSIAAALGIDPGELVSGLTGDMVPVRQPRSENRRKLRAERTKRLGLQGEG